MYVSNFWFSLGFWEVFTVFMVTLSGFFVRGASQGPIIFQGTPSRTRSQGGGGKSYLGVLSVFSVLLGFVGFLTVVWGFVGFTCFLVVLLQWF